MSNLLDRPRVVLSAERDVVNWIGASLGNLAAAQPMTIDSLHEAAKYGFEFRRHMVDLYVRTHCGLHVQSGPFKGMSYLSQAAESLLGPKLIGSYEEELAPILRRLDRYDSFVDVGCAEGYFAVGALFAAPHLRTIAFDTDPRARQLCDALARANGVSDRLQIHDFCSPEKLLDLSSTRTLVMIDIEGAEIELLGSIPAISLMDTDFIVETHRVGGACTLQFVHDHLAETHDVHIVEQTNRDPSVCPALTPLGQLDRFLAQWEGRGPEPWVFAKARGRP